MEEFFFFLFRIVLVEVELEYDFGFVSKVVYVKFLVIVDTLEVCFFLNGKDLFKCNVD